MNRLSKKSKVIMLVSILAFFIVIISLFFKSFMIDDTLSVIEKTEVKKEVNNSVKEFETLIKNEIGSLSSDDIYYDIENVKSNDLNVFDSNDIDYKKRFAYDNLEFFYQYDEYNNSVANNNSYFDSHSDYIRLLAKDTLYILDSKCKSLINENIGLNIDYINYNKNAMIDKDDILNVYDTVAFLYNKDLSKYKKIVFVNSYNSKYIDVELRTTDCIEISSYIYKKFPNIKTYFTQMLVLSDGDFDSKENYNNFIDQYNLALEGQFISFGNLIKDYIAISSDKFKDALSYVALYTNFIDLKEKEFAPHKHITKDDIKATNKKEIYLTFDDGPSENTIKLLDILKKYNVKASFFVTNQHSGFANNLKNIVDEGHTIGAHTYSHNYSIYRSKETFLDDLYKIQCVIRKETNKFTNLIRFPGGSINSNNSKLPMKEFVEEIQDMGYVYYDWNVSSGDGADITSEQTLNNIIAGASKSKQKYIVLMHDTKTTTVNIVEQLIQYLTNNKFEILELKSDSYVCHMVFK